MLVVVKGADALAFVDIHVERGKIVNRGPLLDLLRREGDIEVITPLIQLKKSEIIQLGLSIQAPLEATWSCYSGEIVACGICESCILRLRAFAEAGAIDPIPYEPGKFSD